jgi:hypothetical protein
MAPRELPKGIACPEGEQWLVHPIVVAPKRENQEPTEVHRGQASPYSQSPKLILPGRAGNGLLTKKTATPVLCTVEVR